MRKILALALLLVVPAVAQAEGLASLKRVGLGVNAGFVGNTDKFPKFDLQAFEVGPRISYNLVGGIREDGTEVAFPVSLTLTLDYRPHTQDFRTRVGATIVLKKEGR